MEKKGTGKVVIIILLVIVVLALGGYIFYDKVLSIGHKDNEIVDKKDEEDTLEKVENLEVAGDLVIELVGKITYAMDCTDFKDIYFKDGEFKSGGFSNQEIYSLALRSIYDDVKGDTNTGTGYKDFTSDSLDEAIAKIVGSKYEFTHNSYVSCPAWTYDANSKTYKASEGSACGCTTGPYHTIAKSTKALKIGEKIEIYQRVIFVDTNTGQGYSDSKKTKKITDLVVNSVDAWGNPVNNIDESNENNISKGTLYKLVFEEENGEYVFVSSEPVNE